MKEFLTQTFKKYGFELTTLEQQQFEKYFEFLVQENQKFNLTAITKFEDVVVKHFIDSILPAKEIKQNALVIDVGTGAGFPGVPLKILRPDINLTLLDSLQKRVKFLEEVCSLLNLTNVKCVHSRAEDYTKSTREKFDVSLSRAVAPLPCLCEYLLPYVKVGGKVLMYKSASLDEELKQNGAITLLGGKIEKTLTFTLDEYESTRNILIIKKVKPTPIKYPRGKNQPRTNPLV